MTIRNLDKTDIDEAVALFTATFQDRPFYRYLAPDPAERTKFLVSNFRSRLENGFGVNEINAAVIDDAIDGAIAGIAVWIPPARGMKPPEERYGDIKDALQDFSQGLQERFAVFHKALEDGEKRAVKPPFWGLAPIAVLPEHQGKGIASALIRKKLAEIDKSHLPCFLGTQDKVNLTIYARYGFETICQETLSGDMVHYTMVRKAAD
jgi:GNAT superfamily N-acetyltransferase